MLRLAVRLPRLAALAGLLAALAAAPPARAQDDAARPHVLWIVTEDLSPRIEAYGDPLARTPNIDRLAAQGVRYTRAFTTAGVCAPSRAAILTGMYQNAVGAQHMRVTTEAEGLPTPYAAVPPPTVKALSERLRAAGYYTVNLGKTDYQVASELDHAEPVSAWDRSEGYDANATEESPWRARAPGQPFFAVLNTMATHESRIRRFEGDPETDPAAVEVPPYYPDTPAVRRDLAILYDNVAQMDAWVGRVLARLDADGLADSTVVFFYSDHGDGLPRAKRWVYDAGLRVPLVVRWPGRLPAGEVRDELVSFVDLAPTVLSVAGVRPPAGLQGRAFLGPYAEPAPPYVFAARDRMDEAYDRVRAARGVRFLYLRNDVPDQPYVLWVPYRNQMPTMQALLRLQAEGREDAVAGTWLDARRASEELYDTDADPYQVRNLADDPAYQDQLREMRAAVRAWERELGELNVLDEAVMAARFWPGGVRPVTAPPLFVPNAAGPDRARAASSGGALAAPAALALYSSTQGASLEYALEPEGGSASPWRLYVGPIRLPAGTTTVHARAVRYGFATSPERQATFTVTP